MRRLVDALQAVLEAEQDRWFLWTPVLFGVGVLIYFWLPMEPERLVVISLLAASFMIAMLARDGLFIRLASTASLIVAAGFAAAKVRTDWVAAPVLERQIGPVTVTGWVELVEPRPVRGQRLTVRVASFDARSSRTPAGAGAGRQDGRDGSSERRESWPKRIRVRTLTVNGPLKPGDGVRLRATLSPPAAPALPGGFDFARSAWFLGLGAVGYTRDRVERITIDVPIPFDLTLRAPIERLRQVIGQRITAALPGETGAIANALITGERGAISDATNDAFRDSGLFHILSISGLHMVIMAGAIFLTVRVLLTLVPALALRYPIKKWAAVLAALGALGYLLISGSSFPTVRSYIMISMMFLAVLLDRPAVALRTVAISASAILFVYPESLIDVGFQMSYAAVVALVAGYEMLRQRERSQPAAGRPPLLVMSLFFGGIVLTTLIASFSVAPIAAYHFHKSQQYAVLANLVAIPICNVLVMPAALGVLVAMPFGLEAWPVRIMGLGIDAMVWVAYKVAALPGAVGRMPEMPTLAFALMVSGGIWLCLWRTRWRYAGVAMIAIGLAVTPFRTGFDVLVGRSGTLVAVRAADGRLSAIGDRQSQFELARWLEHDGDDRSAAAVIKAGAFVCDGVGCTAMTKGARVARVAHAAAFGEDCRRAKVIILAVPAPRGCPPSVLVIHPTHQARARAQ